MGKRPTQQVESLQLSKEKKQTSSKNIPLYMKKGMCQNTQNMKITPVTDICSKGNFVKKRVLTPSFYSQI